LERKGCASRGKEGGGRGRANLVARGWNRRLDGEVDLGNNNGDGGSVLEKKKIEEMAMTEEKHELATATRLYRSNGVT
jgi:hypothetical protein